MTPDTVTAGSVARRRSLRREWTRAFAIMLVLLLVGGLAAIVGVKSVVGSVEGTARQLHRESAAVSALSKDVVAHEEVGHQLLSNESVDRAAYVRQQDTIARQFQDTAAIFPAGNLRASVLQAQTLWQQGLTTYGLWSDRLPQLQGNHQGDNPLYGASSDAVGSLLNGLDGPSLDAMDRGLARGSDLEMLLIASLAGLFGLALAVILYFRRRMVRDLLRPVANMHQGVSKLRSGEYEHRIHVARCDELGELRRVQRDGRSAA